jgi:hypothetical protein
VNFDLNGGEICVINSVITCIRVSVREERQTATVKKQRMNRENVCGNSERPVGDTVNGGKEMEKVTLCGNFQMSKIFLKGVWYKE